MRVTIAAHGLAELESLSVIYAPPPLAVAMAFDANVS
jgi:hypothetical protein